MQDNQYAPVLVPTLNRYHHFNRLIQSLEKCPEAKFTDLIIGLDYPPSESYEDGWKKIKGLVPLIKGFNKVIVIEAKKNLGFDDNFNVIHDYVLNNGYEAYIFTEDDNVFSPNFLAFLNWGLKKYKNDEKVIAISGYNYPIDISKYQGQYYFSHNFSAWGYAMTIKNDIYVRKNILKVDYIERIAKNPLKIIQYTSMKGWRSTLGLLKMKRKKIVQVDGYLTVFVNLENRYCIFPTLSKVRNMGHDGTGIHCGITDSAVDIFANQRIDDLSFFSCNSMIPVAENKYIEKELCKYFKNNCFYILIHIRNIFNQIIK